VRRLVTAAAAGLAVGGALLLGGAAQATSYGYPTPGSSPCAGYRCSPSAYPSTVGPTSSTSPSPSTRPSPSASTVLSPTASASPPAPSLTSTVGGVSGSAGRTLPVTGPALAPLAALAALLLAAGAAALLNTRRRGTRP
jgi:hypothetical protein